MELFEETPENYLATLAEMLLADGLRDVASLLRSSTARVEKTGYDNWNGGTNLWTLFLEINPTEFATLGQKKDIYEDKITSRLKALLEQYENDWYSVSIVPRVTPNKNWRNETSDLATSTIRNIIDGLKIEGTYWAGQLDEVEFLQRIFELEGMSSDDSRFETASQDIWQHRVNNPEDWPDDWIYDDQRFKLVNGSTDTFLRFLCEIVHPVVRPDKDESLKLVSQFNDQLRRDGWEIVEEEKIAGRPRYVARTVNSLDTRSYSRARSVAEALDAGWMQKEIERLENSIDTDPALAIGTAKDLVETCCKSILTKLNVSYSKKADLPTLTKLVAKELKLVPDGISDQARGAETIRLILRNLSALTKYISELRGLYGSGHGRDGEHKGLEPRHARLAVGAAVIFIDFVTSTYRKHYDV